MTSLSLHQPLQRMLTGVERSHSLLSVGLCAGAGIHVKRGGITAAEDRGGAEGLGAGGLGRRTLAVVNWRKYSGP